MAQPRPSRGPRRRGSTTALLVLLAAPHAGGALTLPLFGGGGGGPQLKTHKRAGGAGNNGSRNGETRMRGAAGLTIDADGAAGLWKMRRSEPLDVNISDGSSSRHRQSKGSRHHKLDALVPFGPVPRGGSLADISILPPSGAAAAAALTLDQAGGPLSGIRRGAKGARRRIMKTTVHLHRALRFGGRDGPRRADRANSDTELAVTTSSVSMVNPRAAVDDGPRSFLRIGGGINRRLQRKRRAARHARVGAVSDSAVLAASAELSLDVDMEAWTDLAAAVEASSSVAEAVDGGGESSSPPLFGVKLFQRKSVEIESHETIAVRLEEAALSARGGGSAIALDDTATVSSGITSTSSIASTTSLVSTDTYVLETPLFPIILPKAWAPPVASSSSIESAATLEISVALEEDIATTTTADVDARPSPQLLMAAVQPLLPKDAVDTFTGREFYYPESYVSLTATGMTMTLGRGRNPWVDWSGEKKTDAFLRTHGNDGEAGSGQAWYDALDSSQEVLVWAGKFTSKEGYGSELPIIKTKSIIHKSPKYLAELLMDSTRVKAYNKMSLGRTDEVVFQTGVDARGGEFGDGESKVVRNLTKPPMVSSLIEFVTCMHARKLRPDDMNILGEGGDAPSEGYVVVSRAVTGGKWSASDGDRSSNGEKLVRNEVLLGVNVLREVPGEPDKTELTAVTHVYSPMIPQMLAKSAGVKGAIDFIRDVRALP